MKKRILILLLIFNLFGLYAATDNAADDPLGRNFSMYFDKPPKDVFYFCKPDSTLTTTTTPSEYVPSTEGGVQFALPDTSATDGYPSRAYIGIYFDFESRGDLEVFFNASSKLNALDSFRMRPKDIKQTGLNYKIAIGTSYSAAQKNLDTLMSTGEKFYGNVASENAKNAVFTVHANQKGKSTANVVYAKTGLYVFAMEIRSGKSEDSADYEHYVPGQYLGYVTMRYSVIQ